MPCWIRVVMTQVQSDWLTATHHLRQGFDVWVRRWLGLGLQLHPQTVFCPNSNGRASSSSHSLNRSLLSTVKSAALQASGDRIQGRSQYLPTPPTPSVR